MTNLRKIFYLTPEDISAEYADAAEIAELMKAPRQHPKDPPVQFAKALATAFNADE